MTTRHAGARPRNRMMTMEPDLAFVDLVPNLANDAFAVQVPWAVISTAPTKMEWWTGAVSAGNYDLGLYTAPGVKLWTLGSTAVPGANQAVTATVGALTPPLPDETKDVWLVLALSDVTCTFKGVTLLHNDLGLDYDATKVLGRSAAAFPLPAPLAVGGLVATLKKPLILLRSA